MTDAHGRVGSAQTGRVVVLDGTDRHPHLPVTWGVYDSAARHAFTHGQCHAFAAALLEHIAGVPVAGGWVSCDTNCDGVVLPSGLCGCRIDHILVAVDGEYLDISGAWDLDTLLTERFEALIEMDTEDLVALDTHPRWRPAARDVAGSIVVAYLAWLHGEESGEESDDGFDEDSVS